MRLEGLAVVGTAAVSSRGIADRAALGDLVTVVRGELLGGGHLVV